MDTDFERGMVEMLSADNHRLRAAGGRMAEAAMHVVHNADGLHRLALAVSDWCVAVAAEGGRGERHS